VKEGESVTFDPGVVKNPNDMMTWYFNEARIAEITGDQIKICTDVQCEERFRDRLKLDNQTGSLTITHITNTHSGVYHLEILSSRFIIHRQHSISIISEKSLNGTVTCESNSVHFPLSIKISLITYFNVVMFSLRHIYKVLVSISFSNVVFRR